MQTGTDPQSDVRPAASGGSGRPVAPGRPEPPAEQARVEDYSYDGLNRQRTYNRYSAGARAYSTTYLYDALNRVVREIEDNTSVTTRTDMQYEGDSTRVAKEGLTYDGWSGGPNSNSKTFAYEAGGQAITMSEWPAGQALTRLSYLYDPGSSISLLIDEIGIVKESYGYSAYGAANNSLTKKASGFSTGPTPTNPIRFQGKRFDSGSGSYDMGARRYSPGTGRWLQQDFYYDALDNLGLSQDPLTANRYAFLGANPVNYVEFDGHSAFGDWFECKLPGRQRQSKCRKIEQAEEMIGAIAEPIGKFAYEMTSLYDAQEAFRAYKRGDLLAGNVHASLALLGLVPSLGQGGKGAVTFMKLLHRLERARQASAYKVALSGGHHAGTLSNYSTRSITEIEKGAASYEKTVAKHYEWISNPQRKAKNWANMNKKERNGLIRKWRRDIRRNQEIADVLRGLARAKK